MSVHKLACLGCGLKFKVEADAPGVASEKARTAGWLTSRTTFGQPAYCPECRRVTAEIALLAKGRGA